MMNDKTLLLPSNIDARFHPPHHWQWDSYATVSERNIRYGWSVPGNAKAIMFFLPGLNDVPEKYFEIFRYWIDQGYGVITMDWFGQGGSGRYLANPSKRHSDGFEKDTDDFFVLLENVFKPELINDLPCFVTAHSMGGNVLMRILMKDQSWCKGAIHTAPMFAIKALRYIPSFFIKQIYKIFGNHYVPGGMDWKDMPRLPFPVNILTRDEERYVLEDIWMQHNEALRIGGVTYGWIYHAWQSCRILQNYDVSTIKTPSLIFQAEHEHLVDNRWIGKFAKRMPCATLEYLEDSYHEPLLERDGIRLKTLRKINDFVTNTI